MKKSDSPQTSYVVCKIVVNVLLAIVTIFVAFIASILSLAKKA